jgi:hypothetical protein
MPSETPKLRVFISWAGKQAEKIGQGFHDFLPDVVNATQPFMSGSDIDKGSRWNDVLTGSIQESSCAIVCLTPRSLESIWVAFEAGAVSRAAGGPEGAKSRIWTYLLGLQHKDLLLTPFAAYQATNPTEEETFDLIASINQLSPDLVPAESLRRKFNRVFWPSFAKVLEEARTPPVDGTAQTPGEAELLSEILSTVRSIQDGVRPQSGRSSAPILSLLLQQELFKRGRTGTKTEETADGGLFIQVGKKFELLSPAVVQELMRDKSKRRAVIRRLHNENDPVDPLTAALAAEIDS